MYYWKTAGVERETAADLGHQQLEGRRVNVKGIQEGLWGRLIRSENGEMGCWTTDGVESHS